MRFGIALVLVLAPLAVAQTTQPAAPPDYLSALRVIRDLRERVATLERENADLRRRLGETPADPAAGPTAKELLTCRVMCEPVNGMTIAQWESLNDPKAGTVFKSMLQGTVAGGVQRYKLWVESPRGINGDYIANVSKGRVVSWKSRQFGE